ncbi:MAG: hypothetical protein A4E19_09165 [Nitrospira sp. SG-bin1]|nr:MAG: hypothetical protein A4E19_09165 [Nitrospira sp. SG-bin1]
MSLLTHKPAISKLKRMDLADVVRTAHPSILLRDVISQLYLRRSAGRTDEQEGCRQEYGFWWRFLLPDNIAHGESRKIQIDRTGNMVLDPLTDVRLRMFMAIRIGGSQLVVNILSGGERSKPQDDADHPQRRSGAE